MILPQASERALRDVAADYETSLKKGLRRTGRQVAAKYLECEYSDWYSVYVHNPSVFGDARTCKRDAGHFRGKHDELPFGPRHMAITLMGSVSTFRWLYRRPAENPLPCVPPGKMPPLRSGDEIAAALVEVEEKLWYRRWLNILPDLDSKLVKLGSDRAPGIIPRDEFEMARAAASFVEAKYPREVLERADPGAEGRLATLRWLYGHLWGIFTILIEHPWLPLPDAMTEEVGR